jgi:hypothetical protein
VPYGSPHGIAYFALGLGIKEGRISLRPEIYAWLRVNAPDSIGEASEA